MRRIGAFDPILELNQTDVSADSALLALSTNAVTFADSVTDPWYLVTENKTQEDIPIPVVLSDQPASFIGCKVQHQWCEPNENKCTQLGVSLQWLQRRRHPSKPQPKTHLTTP
jgi:hypothetical protein